LDELKVPVAAVAATTVNLSSFCLSLSSSSFYLWHSRLGHVSSSRLRFLASIGALGNLKLVTFQIVVNVNWQNFLLYLLIEVFLFHLHHLI
jgi:hypothetical protein